MGSERRRDKPFVMWFVQSLVEHRVVKPSMDPVDAVVCEQKIEWHGQDEIYPTIIRDVVVQHRLSPNLCDEPREGEDGDGRESSQTGLDLQSDLIFKELGVLHHLMIEKIIIR